MYYIHYSDVFITDMHRVLVMGLDPGKRASFLFDLFREFT